MNDFITGKTKIVGLVGNPVGHTVSPQLHNTISRMLGIDLVYLPFQVKKEDLGTAVKGLKALDVVGFNVTQPYKREIMKYIDDNIKVTFLMGAVNTIKNIEGRLYGYNTDAEGFVRAFRKETDIKFEGKRVTILGAGGASRAIAVRLANLKVQKIYIANRTIDKAHEIERVINDNIGNIVQVYNFQDKKLKNSISESEIIINATSVGMNPDKDETLIQDIKLFNKNQYVYDIIYSPLETKLLKKAKKAGCKTINGAGMLFYQAIGSYEIWTGTKFDDVQIKQLYDCFIKYIKTI